MPSSARRLSRRGPALLGLVISASIAGQAAFADDDALPAPPLEATPLATEVRVPDLDSVEAASPGPLEMPGWLDGELFPLRPGIGEPAIEASEIIAPSIEIAEPPGPDIALNPPEPIAPPPLERFEIMLDWFPSPQHAALYLARERGEFAKHGIEVVLSTPADPDVPTKLLAAQRVDLALTRQPLLHQQVDAGMPLVRVATLVGSPLTALVIREGLGVETPVDLAGLRVGHVGVDSRILIEALLRPHGVRDDEVRIVDLDFELVQPMVGGEVDGVIGGNRHLLPRRLSDEGAGVTSMPVEGHGIPPHDGLILVANRDRLAKRREAIGDLVTAIEAATAWMLDHPDDAWALLVEAEPTLETPTNQAAWADILARLSTRPAAVDQGRYSRFEAFLHQAGLIDAVTPVDRLAIDLGAP